MITCIYLNTKILLIVHVEIFNKFKDNGGKFIESLVTDTWGMLSLYEACHLSIRGENILDEVLAFTVTHLKLIND